MANYIFPPPYSQATYGQIAFLGGQPLPAETLLNIIAGLLNQGLASISISSSGTSTYNVVAPALTNGQTSGFQGDSSGNLKVNVAAGSVALTPYQGTLTDGSGTITAGGTAQTIFAVNASRKYLFIQNQSTGKLYVNFTTTAVAGEPSVVLGPDSGNGGGALIMESSYISTELVSIYGATTGQAFAAKQG